MTYSIWTHRITRIIQVWHTLFVSHLIVIVVLCGLGLHASSEPVFQLTSLASKLFKTKILKDSYVLGILPLIDSSLL